MESNIFEGADQAPNPETNETVANNATIQQEQTVLEFIGDGKKYSNTEEADKGIRHAQDHIRQLEEENALMREKLAKASSVDEVLQAVKQQRAVPSESTSTDQTTVATSEDELKTLIQTIANDTISTREHEETAKKNSQSVADALIAQYGSKDKAKEIYIQKASELNLNLDEIASKSPKAVLELFNIKQGADSVVKGVPAAQQSSVNTATLQLNSQNGAEFGTYQYWTNERKAGRISNSEYYQKTNEYAIKLGDKFFT